MSKAYRTRNLRYKKPALASMGFEELSIELEEIREACVDIHYFIDQEDDETLLNALDGNEEEEFEFKMAFADLEAKAYELDRIMYDYYGWDSTDFNKMYNDCTVALIGNRYRTLGYDFEKEDYFSLTSYEQKLAQTEAGKRLMRLTKAEMISTIGQCFGLLIAFLDLRQSYDYLKTTFDILRDENTSLLKQIKEIDTAYEAADAAGWLCVAKEVSAFERLTANLPDRAWIE